MLPVGQQWLDYTTLMTCSWSISSATMVGEGTRRFCDDVFEADPPIRAGFTVEEGCDLSSSWFLPLDAFPWDGRVRTYSTYHLGFPWYQGSVLSQTSTSTATSWTTTSSYWSILHTRASRQRRFSVELSSGFSFLREP